MRVQLDGPPAEQAPDPTAMNVGHAWSQQRRSYAIAMVVALVGFWLLAVAYAVRGTLNADEGWYLLAAQRATAGDLPYRDFLFTQPPLFAYLYALPAMSDSTAIWLSRMLSVTLSTTAVFLIARLLHRRSGYPAALTFAILLAASPIAVYFLSITKTYAVLLLLFTIAWTAGSSWSSRWAIPLAAVAIAVAVGVRLTAAPFFLLPAWHTWRRVPTVRLRVLAWLPAAIVTIGWLAMLTADPSAARFGVFDFHSMYRHGDALWHATPLIERLMVFISRVPNAVAAAPVAVLFILVTTVLAGFSRLRDVNVPRSPSDAPVVAATIVLYVLVHAAAGQFLAEYFVPVLPLALAVALMAWANMRRRWSWSDPPFARLMTVVATAAVTASVIAAATSPLPFFNARTSPHAELAAVARFVAEHTRPTDTVWALEGLWVNVLTERRPPSGMTMAQFSYLDLPADDARRVGAVNYGMVVEAVAVGMPAAVVITGYDLQVLSQRSAIDDRQRGTTDAFLAALESQYQCALYNDRWGQSRSPVWVFLLSERVGKAAACPAPGASQ